MAHTIKNLMIVILTITVIILLFQGCEKNKKYDDAVASILQLQNEKQELLKTVDEQGREIAAAKVVVIPDGSEVQKQLSEFDEIKELETKIVYRTNTVYNKIEVPLYDTIIIVSHDTVKAEKFSFQDQWLTLSGNIVDSTMTFDSLLIANKYTIEVGEAKTKWYKPKEKMVYIRNENPHTKTQEVQSFVIDGNKKWWQRGTTKAAGVSILALLIGIGL